MSEENVRVMKEMIERFNRNDIAGMLPIMDSQIRFEHRMAQLEGDMTGVDAVRDWFADLTQHFDSWRIDCDDLRDLGDRVLALGTLYAVGKGSGVEADVPYTVVATFHDGLCTHFIDYGDRDKALEAAGLSE
jgi:ketosteroid isomerase-like protein